METKILEETGGCETAALVQEGFLSWFNNHMAMVSMLIQYVRPRPAECLLRMGFFLHDIEHHYLESGRSKAVSDAFRYLRRYFRVYPKVEAGHSRRAHEMIARIYAALGLEKRLPALPL